MEAKEMSTEIPQDLTTFLKTYLITILVMLNLEPSHLGYLLISVFVDSFFGVIKSVRLGKSFEKEKFWWGITKKLSILFIPFLLAVFGYFFAINLVFLVAGFIYLIAASDLVSILSNIASIYTMKEYKTVDFIEKGIHGLIDWISSTANKVLQAFKNEIPKDPDQL